MACKRTLLRTESSSLSGEIRSASACSAALRERTKRPAVRCAKASTKDACTKRSRCWARQRRAWAGILAKAANPRNAKCKTRKLTTKPTSTKLSDRSMRQGDQNTVTVPGLPAANKAPATATPNSAISHRTARMR